MKKFYTSPELEVTLLMAEDVLTSSPELDKEIDFEPDENFWGD